MENPNRLLEVRVQHCCYCPATALLPYCPAALLLPLLLLLPHYPAGASPGTFIPHNRDYLAISKPAQATIANLAEEMQLQASASTWRPGALRDLCTELY